MLCGSLDGSWVGERMDICICNGWVPLLSTWSYYNFVNWLYSTIKWNKVYIKKYFSWNKKFSWHLRASLTSSAECSLTLPCSVQFSSVTQLCLTLCDIMNCSMPGLLVHHQLLEFTQTHIHRVSDAIQPSHPLSFPSPPAPNPSQHQSLFQWVKPSHEVAKVLEFQL